jgi:uncharacterized protein YxjI
MKYQVKQKIFSFGDSFTIKNEYGDDVYLVRGKVFSLGKKLTIDDLNGNELVYIEQKLLKLLPQYTIYMEGSAIATVKKEFSVFTPRFNIESDMGEYKIEGDVFSHEFVILKDNSTVGEVSKEWFSFSDTYGVKINDNENQAFMLALIIVIDEVQSSNKNNS